MPISSIIINLYFFTASEKLKVNGVRVVLESDGTVIDDGEVMRLLAKETFILLQFGEEWLPEGHNVFNDSSSTITGNNSSLSETSLNAVLIPTPNPKEVEVENPDNTNNKSENFWVTFNIPWQKMLSTTLSNCEKGCQNKRSVSDAIQYFKEKKELIYRVTSVRAYSFTLIIWF